MRLPSLLKKIAVCGTLWIGVVLVSGVVGLLLPVLWTIGEPSSSEDYGVGIAMIFSGLLGLVVGTLPATISVIFLNKRLDRQP
ncbi:MAG TPA: hypothetical protein VMF52_20395 [Steroidobacteraceae bacterium]|nr:hypothetical protein [Steroidobacteraceae bacterium]